MTTCNRDDCVIDIPERLDEYRLRWTPFIESYCDDHDPRQNPTVGGMWQLATPQVKHDVERAYGEIKRA